MKRGLKRKIENDLVEVGVYVVFRREPQHRVLGAIGGDGSGSSIKSRASMREGGMRYLTAMSAVENGVAVSTNECSLRQTVGAKMLVCITKTVDGNALKNSERKDRHAPYFTRVPYLSKSHLCRRSYSVTVPQHRLKRVGR